jgi:hypothetical protein
MPTDLDPAFARKRAVQTHAQAETTIMLICLIIFLGIFGLVFEVYGH